MSSPEKPRWERERGKQHLALLNIRKVAEDIAITDLGREMQHLRDQLFRNLAPTGICLIWGLRD